MVCGAFQATAASAVTGVNIDKATLCCTFVQPPPRFISSALSANVSYAIPKFLRYRLDPQDKAHVPINGKRAFKLVATSFPYMPSAFLFSVKPDYNYKTHYVGNADQDVTYIKMSKRTSASRSTRLT